MSDLQARLRYSVVTIHVAPCLIDRLLDVQVPSRELVPGYLEDMLRRSSGVLTFPFHSSAIGTMLSKECYWKP
jgi:hypothetical protein